jgi:Tfp pilus assembly protein PilF
MPAAYTLQPGGRDVYRHFALPLTRPLDRPRWIRAFEFHPGSRQVHHAFLYLGRTNDTQRLDAVDPVIGFGGMDTPPEIHSPGGYFLSWQPGKRVLPLPPGMAWKLEPGMDLVMQLHLQTGGKPEPIQATVGLWFADSPATNPPVKLGLNIYDLDLPPGQSNLVYGREFVVPGDADLLGLLPHTHYLGRRIEAWAEFPDQTRRDLLTIPDWDFNWQGDYRYETPVFLPHGTRLKMRFVFDNTSANPHNPSNPPRRVGFGMSTTDEMAELWFQLLPRTPRDRAALERAIGLQTAREVIAYNEVRLRANPTNAVALVNLGRAKLVLGDRAGAYQALTNAVALDPASDEGHYFLGVIHRMAGRTGEAMEEFQRAIDANPAHGRAQGNLGIMALEAGRTDEAADHFSAALQADPDDNLARTSLAEIRLNQGNRPEAIALLEEAVRRAPGDAKLAQQLKRLKIGR